MTILVIFASSGPLLGGAIIRDNTVDMWTPGCCPSTWTHFCSNMTSCCDVKWHHDVILWHHRTSHSTITSHHMPLYSILTLKSMEINFFYLVTLTCDLWPWPSNSFNIPFRSTAVLKFVICQTVQPWKCPGTTRLTTLHCASSRWWPTTYIKSACAPHIQYKARMWTTKVYFGIKLTTLWTLICIYLVNHWNTIYSVPVTLKNFNDFLVTDSGMQTDTHTHRYKVMHKSPLCMSTGGLKYYFYWQKKRNI